jgi:sporadic carbohydrate cluster 2OG-Fe(II) oxygenase
MINFLTNEEDSIISEFNSKGFIKVKHSDILSEKILERFNQENRTNLENIHDIQIDDFNKFRMSLINNLNSNLELHRLLYFEHKTYIDTLLGNELCMQKRINLSIHRPNTTNDKLDIHSDALCGNSNYELVLWLPLTKAFDSNSMYILPLEQSFEAAKKLKSGKFKDIEELKDYYKESFEFLEVEPGESVIFTHNLLHGNVVNETSQSRVSINLRFKSTLTPFGNKKMGSYYMPINTRPMTLIGRNFYEI